MCVYLKWIKNKKAKADERKKEEKGGGKKRDMAGLVPLEHNGRKGSGKRKECRSFFLMPNGDCGTCFQSLSAPWDFLNTCTYNSFVDAPSPIHSHIHHDDEAALNEPSSLEASSTGILA